MDISRLPIEPARAIQPARRYACRRSAAPIPSSKSPTQCLHEKTFLIDVQGENNLKKIDLFRNTEHYKRWAPEGKTFRIDLTVREDVPSNWYVRVTQVDNHMAWSSPVWFEG